MIIFLRYCITNRYVKTCLLQVIVCSAWVAWLSYYISTVCTNFFNKDFIVDRAIYICFVDLQDITLPIEHIPNRFKWRSRIWDPIYIIVPLKYLGISCVMHSKVKNILQISQNYTHYFLIFFAWIARKLVQLVHEKPSSTSTIKLILILIYFLIILIYILKIIILS